MRFQWRAHRLSWNLSGGRLGRKVVGMPVLELVTRGHKSGLDRNILITYVDSGGNPAIIGSNAGRDSDPAWVRNLRAQPEARARWAGQWRNVVAQELEGIEYESVWLRAVSLNSDYETYRQGMTRHIPIFRLNQP